MREKEDVNKFFRYIIVLLCYIVFTVFFNYSLILGKNLMKWDIMDAYYPLCMSTADMLQNGRLPLWNAAFQFGCPAYIMLGIPYWYPTTLLFELTTGYSLFCVGLEYCIHVVVACFGMFLLAREHLEEKETAESYVVAVIAGAFYGFSGLFVSNAEHIMIIVSAAWLPYVLLFVKKYLSYKKHIFLMAAAICMGLSILGGYPEVWIATFIILIPYFLIHAEKENRYFIKIVKAAAVYLLLGLETAAMAAISLIPFLLSARYIERLGGGVTVNSYSIKMLLSMILPHYSEYMRDVGEQLDISMISMYAGLLTLVLLVWAMGLRIERKWEYLGICLFSFFMMLGNNFVIHPIFYRYFPMFNSLRFPSLWRCILTVFLLLVTACALEQILKKDKSIKKLLITGIICGGIFFLVRYVIFSFFAEQDYITDAFKIDLFRDSIIFFVYAAVCAIILFGKIKKKCSVVWLLVFAAAADIFICQQSLYSATVVSFEQWNKEQMELGKDIIKERYAKDAERIHSIDYSNAKRSQSGLDSTGIVLNHTLDEMGYLSIQLDYIQKYRISEHCKNSLEVPAVYITSDVVDKTDVEFEEWLQNPDISPYQIYVEEKQEEVEEKNVTAEVNTERFISGDIQIKTSKDTAGYLVVQQSWYPWWRVAVDGQKAEIVKINNAFIGVYLEAGEHQINFYFQPVDFYIGACITMVFLTLFLVNLFYI